MDNLTKLLIGEPSVLDGRDSTLEKFDNWVESVRKYSEPNLPAIEAMFRLHIELVTRKDADIGLSIELSLRFNERRNPHLKVRENYNALKTLISKDMLDVKIHPMVTMCLSGLATTDEAIVSLAYLLKWIDKSKNNDEPISPAILLKTFPRGLPTSRDLYKATELLKSQLDLEKLTEHMS